MMCFGCLYPQSQEEVNQDLVGSEPEALDRKVLQTRKKQAAKRKKQPPTSNSLFSYATSNPRLTSLANNNSNNTSNNNSNSNSNSYKNSYNNSYSNNPQPEFTIFDHPYHSEASLSDSVNTNLFSVQGAENASHGQTTRSSSKPTLDRELSALRSTTGTSILAPTSKAVRKEQMDKAFKQYAKEEKENRSEHSGRSRRKASSRTRSEEQRNVSEDTIRIPQLELRKKSRGTARQGYGNSAPRMFG